MFIFFISELKTFHYSDIKGSNLVASVRAKTYLSNIRSLIDTLREVPDFDILDNSECFLKKIEIHRKDKSIGPSTQIIKDFLSTEKKF